MGSPLQPTCLGSPHLSGEPWQSGTPAPTPIPTPASRGLPRAHPFRQVPQARPLPGCAGNFSRSPGARATRGRRCSHAASPPLSGPIRGGPREGRAPARAQGTRPAGQGGRLGCAARPPPASPLPAGGAAPAAAPPLAGREPEGLCQPAADLPGCAPRPVRPSRCGCHAEGDRETPGRTAPCSPERPAPWPAGMAVLLAAVLASSLYLQAAANFDGR